MSQLDTIYCPCNHGSVTKPQYRFWKTEKCPSGDITFYRNSRSVFFLISTQSYQGIKLVKLVDAHNLAIHPVSLWHFIVYPYLRLAGSPHLTVGPELFFFLISTQSYQGIKLVELVDGVCWGCVFFFLIFTQSYQGIKLVELVDGVCWGCVFFFLISTQSYQGIKLVELVDELINGRVNTVNDVIAVLHLLLSYLHSIIS
ncbi:hypothetical protein LAZ67_10000281, partial [Cordylochernes scorpioides]